MAILSIPSNRRVDSRIDRRQRGAKMCRLFPRGWIYEAFPLRGRQLDTVVFCVATADLWGGENCPLSHLRCQLSQRESLFWWHLRGGYDGRFMNRPYEVAVASSWGFATGRRGRRPLRGSQCIFGIGKAPHEEGLFGQAIYARESSRSRNGCRVRRKMTEAPMARDSLRSLA